MTSLHEEYERSIDRISRLKRKLFAVENNQQIGSSAVAARLRKSIAHEDSVRQKIVDEINHRFEEMMGSEQAAS